MKNKGLRIAFSITGIVIGVIIIIVGLVNFNLSYNGTGSKEIYGGDAYTGIQQASAQSATNTYHVLEVVQNFSKIATIITGILVILHYTFELIKVGEIEESSKKKKEDSKETKKTAVIVTVVSIATVVLIVLMGLGSYAIGRIIFNFSWS